MRCGFAGSSGTMARTKEGVRMVQGRNVIWTAALAVALMAVSVSQAQPPAQQQAIPDAPRPQPLPDLKTITPVGASVTPPPAQASASTSDGQQAPGTSLPSSPAARTPQTADDNFQAPPETGATKFVLP